MNNKLTKYINHHLENIRTNWFVFLVIGIVTLAYTGAFHLFQKLTLPVFLEVEGTAVVLAGTLWAFLGVVINRKEKEKLIEMQQSKNYDMDVVIGSLISASNFSVQGAVIIIIGAALLVTKMFMAA